MYVSASEGAGCLQRVDTLLLISVGKRADIVTSHTFARARRLYACQGRVADSECTQASGWFAR